MVSALRVMGEQRFLATWLLAGLLVALCLPQSEASPILANPTVDPCGSFDKCSKASGPEVCFLDEINSCIRKYPSQCHLEIAACRMRQAVPEFSNDICTMETFYCEIGYERWTIFFGHENDK